MVKQCALVLHFIQFLGYLSPLQRPMDDRIDKLVCDRPLGRNRILPKFHQPPEFPIDHTRKGIFHRSADRKSKPVGGMLPPSVRTTVGGRVREVGRQRLYVLSEQELRRGVKSEPRQNVLNINRDVLLETGFQLGDHLVGMAVKDVEVSDPVLVEEWSGE